MPFPSKLALICCSANSKLAQDVTKHLKIPRSHPVRIAPFSDNELDIEVLQNVRGNDVFILQSINDPAERNLMELILMADACRRGSAERITAVVPYFGYARQDRRVRSARVPISAKVVATMLDTVGIDRVLTVDLHSEQIQGFFNVPVDNVYAMPVFYDAIKAENFANPIVVSPDIGGVVRARAIAKRIGNLDLAIVDKRRARANHSEVMHIIGDVKGKDCILVDDIVDTAGTLCQAAAALKQHGARQVFAYATHGVLSGEAITKIDNSQLDKLLITDTITGPKISTSNKIAVTSMAPMLAWAIQRVNRGASISALFV